MGASKWHGTIRSNLPIFPTRRAQSSTSRGMFSYTSVLTTGATSSLLVIRAQLCSGSSRLDGPKYSACSALRCHPSRSLCASLMSSLVTVRAFAFVLMSNRFRNLSAPMVKLLSSPDSSRSASGMASGAFSDTYTTASVTSSVLLGLCRNAHSVNETYDATPSAGGWSISYSNSSSQLAASRPSTPVGKIPKNAGGRFTGHDHWSGAIQVSASGNRRWNGPTKILCSNRVVGSTMCSTGASSSASSAMHSSVGATGACTHSPPVLSLITVMRTFTETFSPRPMPCFCSKNHMRPGSTS